jgi:hypothetical protein
MPGQGCNHGQAPCACYHWKMLTRGQVAKRLGKSIATVRRMEGRALHPKRDQKGVLRFDPAEVERVVRQPLRPGVGQPRQNSARQSRWFASELSSRRDEDEDCDVEERAKEEQEGAEEPRFKEDEQRAIEGHTRRAAEDAVRQEFDRREREDDGRRRDEQSRGEQQRREADAAQDLATKTELLFFLEMRSDREVRRLMRDPEFAAIVNAVVGTE